LIVGWLGSRERHLRGLAQHYEKHLDVEACVWIPRTFEAMSLPGGWVSEGKRFAEHLARLDRDRALPFSVHAFSNAGFWSLRALLEALPSEARARHRATILDSAPGFPESFSPRFTAKYASRAMLPGILAALGRQPSHSHPLFTPPVAALLGLWHLIAPSQIRFMQSSLGSMQRAHLGKPLLAIWGGADLLVPRAHVERFLDEAERAGVQIERFFFPEGQHVRHLVSHRQPYLAACTTFLGTRSNG
jgi:fermentation-respiration switch protein FrsA (DUF1100 family)